MKMKLDKKYILASQLDDIKQAAKEFKEMFTDGDLKMVAIDQLGINGLWGQDIVYCNVEAYAASYDLPTTASFSVDMMVEGYNAIYKIRYCCKIDYSCERFLKVNTDPGMYSIKTFNAA